MIDIRKTPIKKVPSKMGDEAFQEAINRGAERDGRTNPHQPIAQDDIQDSMRNSK